MSATVAIVCPVCGAPREPGGDRCDYCGSWLLATPNATFPDGVRDDLVREHVARFRTQIESNAADVVALHGLGVAFRNLGLLDDAIQVLVRAANLRPESLNIQRALAGTLHDAVRRQPAEGRMWRDVQRQADRIIALDPDSSEGWWLRAEVALRSRDHARLLAVAPDLASYDVGGDHAAFIAYLEEAGRKQIRDWRWPNAVDSWEALAALDDNAGRTALVAFLLQNVRLVPRGAGRVWRALRQTMALRGDFRQSGIAAIALGVAVAFAVTAIGLALASHLFPAMLLVGLIVWPLITWLVMRWRLVGWPPWPTPRQPWADIATEEIVRVARDVAPMIEKIRPR
jgi:tetratricopeptide (TPR) repeat protein